MPSEHRFLVNGTATNDVQEMTKDALAYERAGTAPRSGTYSFRAEEGEYKDYEGEKVDTVGAGDLVDGGEPDEHKLHIQIMVDVSGSVGNIMKPYTTMVNRVIENIKHIPNSPLVSFGLWHTNAQWFYKHVTADQMPKVRFLAPGGTDPRAALIAHRLLELEKREASNGVINEPNNWDWQNNLPTAVSFVDKTGVSSELEALTEEAKKFLTGKARLTTLAITITDGEWPEYDDVTTFAKDGAQQAKQMPGRDGARGLFLDPKVTHLWIMPAEMRNGNPPRKSGYSRSAKPWARNFYPVDGTYMMSLEPRHLETEVGRDISRIIAEWSRQASRQALTGNYASVNLEQFTKKMGEW